MRWKQNQGSEGMKAARRDLAMGEGGGKGIVRISRSETKGISEALEEGRAGGE